MFELLHRHRRKLLCIMVSIPALLSACTMMLGQEEKVQQIDHTQSFSVLILGDSQMAGYCWTGGYANCILETYPNAQVFNLAQSGSLLANGDIYAQWEYYCSETTLLPDFILLDGGINDMPYLKKEEFKDTALPLVSKALCTLVEQIHEVSPDTRIIYTLMPPFAEWKESEEGPPSYEIQEAYWQQLNNIAGAYDYVTVVDLFSINPFDYPDVESYQANLADSIHLNETGYRNTFEYINNALVSHLADSLDD